MSKAKAIRYAAETLWNETFGFMVKWDGVPAPVRHFIVMRMTSAVKAYEQLMAEDTDDAPSEPVPSSFQQFVHEAGQRVIEEARQMLRGWGIDIEGLG